MSKKGDMLEEFDFSKGKRGAVIPHKGKTRITIWVDTGVLDWFKERAEQEGLGYQTALNQALRSYIRQDKQTIKAVVKEAVREEMSRMRKAG